jgi:hypothetical protein
MTQNLLRRCAYCKKHTHSIECEYCGNEEDAKKREPKVCDGCGSVEHHSTQGAKSVESDLENHWFCHYGCLYNFKHFMHNKL